jgi:hypothetical protein
MDVCVRLFFVMSCVQVAALRLADPRPRSPTDSVKHQEIKTKAKAQQNAIKP